MPGALCLSSRHRRSYAASWGGDCCMLACGSWAKMCWSSAQSARFERLPWRLDLELQTHWSLLLQVERAAPSDVPVALDREREHRCVPVVHRMEIPLLQRGML